MGGGSPLTLILNKAFTPSSYWMTVLRTGKELFIWKTFKCVKVQPLIQGHELPGDCLEGYITVRASVNS